MPDVRTEAVTYSAGGGMPLKGHLATTTKSDAKRPGVLVVHEWWGLNDYVRGRAEQLAALGYTALAVDMYGDGKTATDPDGAGKLMNGVLGDRPALEARFRGAYDFLKAQDGVAGDRIAAIGYCFGGAVVLHAARIGMPLAAVVSFHGALGSFHKPAPGSVTAKVLVCHGAADTFVSDAEVAAFEQEMKDAKADYRIAKYPGVLHSFTDPESTAKGKKFGLPVAYDANADRQSWDDMKALFKQTIG
jgi:dienelactone hydrolase